MHHFSQGTYFEPRQTQEELCRDFPADRTFIGGLERMQSFFSNRNQPIQIPILRTMNLAHTIIAYMLSNECLDQFDYDYIAYDGHGHDDQLKIITLIVVAAMLARTDNSFRATVCRDLVLERRPQDFYEGVTLYDDFLHSSEKRFAEEDFLIDIPALVAQNQQLQYENEQLQTQIIDLQYTITTMEKEKPQTIVYNYGTFNDIHDNPYSTIYTTAPDKVPTDTTEHADPQPSKDILPIPAEGKYTEVRNYIKERCRFDEEFKTFFQERSLRELCDRLTKEFGWFVDEHSLGANLNRHR